MQGQADNKSELKPKGGIQGRMAAGLKIEAGKDELLILLESKEWTKDLNQRVLNEEHAFTPEP